MYYAIPAARTCLNLCLVSLCLPSSSRFGDLLPTISYLRASQGRRAVKIPTVGVHRWADRRDHWESLKDLIIEIHLLGAKRWSKSNGIITRPSIESQPDLIHHGGWRWANRWCMLKHCRRKDPARPHLIGRVT